MNERQVSKKLITKNNLVPSPEFTDYVKESCSKFEHAV